MIFMDEASKEGKAASLKATKYYAALLNADQAKLWKDYKLKLIKKLKRTKLELMYSILVAK